MSNKQTPDFRAAALGSTSTRERQPEVSTRQIHYRGCADADGPPHDMTIAPCGLLVGWKRTNDPVAPKPHRGGASQAPGGGERLGGRAVRPFVVNGHDRLVFPSNFIAELDFSVLETLEQLGAVIRRDFEAKAPTGSEILERVDSDAYRSRYELLRDLAMNLVWGNRYAMTMYEKRPTRWRDLPRRRDDVSGGQHIRKRRPRRPRLQPCQSGVDHPSAVARTRAARFAEAARAGVPSRSGHCAALAGPRAWQRAPR
jgi:hypothetical protein